MKHAAILGVLIAGLAALVWGKIITTAYSYDEADYMFAASLGWYPNWWDEGSLSIADFVKIGLGRGTDPRQRMALSQMARDSKDPVVYRHWHGPLYYYWLAALPSNLAEGAVRGLSLVFAIATAAVLYFGTLRLLPAPAAQPAAMLACALVLWGQMTVRTTELAPHMLFILCYVAALLLLARVMQQGGRRAWYGAVVLSGLAFCTLEVAFVLIATLVACGWLRRATLAADWRFVRNSAAALLGTILLVWPAALLKANFLKAYLFMAYLAMFRRRAWGNFGVAQAWALRLALSPVEWLAIGAALVLFVKYRLWRKAPALIPFLVYGVLMLLAMARVNGEGPRYLTPFLPAWLIFAAWVLAQTVRARWAMAAAVCVLLFAVTRAQLASYLPEQDPRPGAMLAAIRSHGLEGGKVLVPQMDLPTLHYYFPRATLRGYLETAQIRESLQAERFDAVLYPDYPVRVETTQPVR